MSRLEITRETVEEILGEGSPPAAEPVPVGGDGGAGQESAPETGPPVEVVRRGVVTVPPWEPGSGPSVLPATYRDVLEVLANAGGAMRAGRISMAVGRGESAARVEGGCVEVPPPCGRTRVVAATAVQSPQPLRHDPILPPLTHGKINGQPTT